MSAQQRRQERELEELRKQGLAMPARDESGNLINPHIPSYLSKTPWYYGSDGQATLKHQRQEYHQQTNAEQIQGGISAIRTQTNEKIIEQKKFRPGACTNCGAMGHSNRDCLQKQRIVTAKFANTTYATKDEIIKTNKLTFEAKRDRFANFTEDDWAKHSADAKRLEEEQLAQLLLIETQEAQKQRAKNDQLRLEKVQKIEAQRQAKIDAGITVKWQYLADDFDTDDEWDDIYGEADIALNNNNINQTMKTSLSIEDRIKLNPKLAQHAKHLFNEDVININKDGSVSSKGKVPGLGLDLNGTGMPSTRLLTDVPKYLLNIEDENAYYDPKTHSMRENPFQRDDPRWLEYETLYNSHNYAVDHIKELELFAYEFKELTGKEINPVLNPTLVSKLKREFDERKAQTQLDKEQLLNQLYGDIYSDNNNTKKDTNNDNDDIIHQSKKQRTLFASGGLVHDGMFDNTTDDVSNQHTTLNIHGEIVTADSNHPDNNDNTINGNGNDDIIPLLPMIKKPAPHLTIPNAPIISNTIDIAPHLLNSATDLSNLSKTTIKSKYAEDIFEGNHTAIWGSYYDISTKKWGYKCCQSTIRYAYCIPIKKDDSTSLKRKEPTPI